MKNKKIQSVITNNNSKVVPINKQISNHIPTYKRTDEWIKRLSEDEESDRSKNDALKVINYLKEELTSLKELQSNTAICRLNLRSAVHYLNTGGYELLGYSSLKACLETEFSSVKTLSTLYREAKAAQLEVSLLGDDKIGSVKESVLRPLGKLKEDRQMIHKAWKKAMAAKLGKSPFPTAEEVKHAVTKLLEGNNEDEKPRWSNNSAFDIGQRIAPKLAKELNKYGKIKRDRIDAVLNSIEELLLENPQE